MGTRVEHVLLDKGVALLNRQCPDIVNGGGNNQPEKLILLQTHFFTNMIGNNSCSPVMRL